MLSEKLISGRIAQAHVWARIAQAHVWARIARAIYAQRMECSTFGLKAQIL